MQLPVNPYAISPLHDIVYLFTIFKKKRGDTCTLVTTPFLFFSSFLVIFTIRLAYHKVKWYNFININNLLECFQKGMLTMDEKDYELLLELNESKNITKTAQKLYMTQPAITKRIQKMEEELQCTLFLRSKKGILFTPAGEQILPYASEILANSRKLKEQVSACQNQVCGTLRLGSSLNFSHYQLPRIIKAYTDRYPLVDVQITTGQSKHLFQLLNRDEIAIAIMRGRYVWDEAIQLISSEPMCFVCSKENQGRSLSEYSYICRHTDSDLSARIDRWLTAHDLAQIRPHMWIDSIDTCKEMARYGLGWCILPRICLDDFDGYIEELYMEDGSPFLRNTYVLYKHQYAELPQVKLFLDALLGSSVSENKF